MGSRRNAAVETASAAGWARRALRQQLDALSRLTAIAWGLVKPATPPTPPAESSDLGPFFIALRGFEKAARLQVRVDWALRLIDALRGRLHAELEAIDKGQTPALPVAAPSLAAEAAPAEDLNPSERPERPERERLRDYERFSFQGRAADNKLAEILKRPTVEIIALICRELGLPEDWPRLAEEAWADEAPNEDWAEPTSEPEMGASPSPPRIPAAPS